MIESEGKLLQGSHVSGRRNEIRTDQYQKLLPPSLRGHLAKLLLIEDAYVRLGFCVFGRLLLDKLLQTIMLDRRYYQRIAIAPIERDGEDDLVAQVLAKIVNVIEIGRAQRLNSRQI